MRGAWDEGRTRLAACATGQVTGDGWRKVRLGEIATFIQTGPFGSQLHQYDYSDEGTPVVMPKDIVEGGISEASVARVGADHVERLARHQVETGDFLFSRRGDVGRCALIHDKEAGWLCGTGCLRVGVDPAQAASQFLLYCFSQHDIVAWLEGHAVGATMPNINPTILGDLPFDLPPLPIQRKIAEILGAYDDLIENNRRRIALLEKMARELYRERFVRRAESQMQTKSAEEWFGDISIGKTPPRKQAEHFAGDIPWVSIADMGRSGMFVFETSECLAATSVEKLRVKIVPSKTLLMSFKLTVGRLAITTCECCTNEAIAHFRVGEEKLPYMYLYLSEYEFQKLGNTCAISDGINSKIVKAMPIDLPDEKVMVSFNELAMPLFDEMYLLSMQNRNLARQRDRLLPRLLSGKLDVSKLVKEGV